MLVLVLVFGGTNRIFPFNERQRRFINMKLFPCLMSTFFSHVMMVTPFSLIHSRLSNGKRCQLNRASKPLSQHTTKAPVTQRQSAGPQGWNAPKAPHNYGCISSFWTSVFFVLLFPLIPFPIFIFHDHVHDSTRATTRFALFNKHQFDRSIDPIPTFLTFFLDKRPMLSQMTR